MNTRILHMNNEYIDKSMLYPHDKIFNDIFVQNLDKSRIDITIR